MAVAKPQYLAFNAGEMDANGLARADLENYARGAETIENCFVYIQGRMEKAPGTIFVSDISSYTKAVLRPFVFSETVKFTLELSDSALRIINGEEIVQYGSGSGTLSGTWVDDTQAISSGGGAAPSIDVSDFDYNYGFNNGYYEFGLIEDY